MRCGHCGGKTRVSDSRDSPTEDTRGGDRRHQWLIRQGENVFGWWATDFRLRRRRCLSADCARTHTTIEITVQDLQDAFGDLRRRYIPQKIDFENAGLFFLDRSEIETMFGNLRYESRKETLITRRTLHTLLEEIRFRRDRKHVLDTQIIPS